MLVFGTNGGENPRTLFAVFIGLSVAVILVILAATYYYRRRGSSPRAAEGGRAAEEPTGALAAPPLCYLGRLSEKQISALPRHYVGDKLSDAAPAHLAYETGQTCMVCLSAYAPGEEALVLPCNHIFHAVCLAPWLRTNTRCPVCGRPACPPAG
ncbi:hypothetical protein H4R19_000818 [Coemansia spiralis]|nr:hypothetical protein H4R19_000818 [Coemansia spiralis]